MSMMCQINMHVHTHTHIMDVTFLLYPSHIQLPLFLAGSYVALTLLGRPSGQQMSSTPIQAGSMPTQASSVTSQLPPPYPSHDGSPVNIVLPSSTGRGDDRSPLSGHSSGPKGEERTPISGPTAVDVSVRQLGILNLRPCGESQYS